MQENNTICMNCAHNPINKDLNVKMVEVTLEIDDDLDISDCKLCHLVLFLCNEAIFEGLAEPSFSSSNHQEVHELLAHHS